MHQANKINLRPYLYIVVSFLPTWFTTLSDSWAKFISLCDKVEGTTNCNETLAFFLRCLYIKPFLRTNLVSPLEKPRLIVTLPDSSLLLISANLTYDACFISNSCLFRPINLSTTLTSLSFLLFLNCFFLFTPDEKWVLSGNLGPLIFPMTKSCAGSSMHNASVVPLKMDD